MNKEQVDLLTRLGKESEDMADEFLDEIMKNAIKCESSFQMECLHTKVLLFLAKMLRAYVEIDEDKVYTICSVARNDIEKRWISRSKENAPRFE